MSKFIYVRSSIPYKKDGGSPVVLTEIHEDHPEGEVFISDPDKWVKVAETKAVLDALGKGTLVKRTSPDEAPGDPYVPQELDDVPMGDMGDAAAPDAAALGERDIDQTPDGTAASTDGSSDELTGQEGGTQANADDSGVFAIETGETVDSLSKRLNKGELTMMADYYGATYTADNNKTEIAEAILAKASE